MRDAIRFVCWIAVFSLALPYARAEEPAAPVVVDTLCTYKGQSISTESVTGVSAADTARVLAELTRQFGLAPDFGRRDGGFLRPAVEPWNDRDHPTLQNYYIYNMNGVLDYYVRSLVLAELKRRYADVKVIAYDATQVEPQVQRQTELQDLLNRILLDAALNKASIDTLMTDLRKAFPKMANVRGFDPDTWQHALDDRYKTLPYRLINARCFPQIVNGKPVPWAHWEVDFALVRYLITEIVTQDLEKYLELTEKHVGSWRVLEINHVKAAELETAQKIIGVAVNANDEISDFGVRFAGKTLENRKSSIEVGIMFGDRAYILEQTGLAEKDFVAKKLLRVREHPDGSADYIYLPKNRAATGLKERNPLPGTFLFGTGMKAIVTPIAAEIVRDINPHPLLHLRSVDEIAASVRDGTIWDEFLGEKMPLVLPSDKHP